ncbi:MAG: FAD synthetase family protein [Clostridia bacterium]|nr:FAD synthetase family protein [Clostridia bacterium]
MEKNAARVIALGTFDGMHPGHRAVIRACVLLAREKHAEAMVYTFIENPKSLFGPKPLQLMTPEEKTAAILGLGVDRVENVHFTRALADMQPEAFVDMLCLAYRPCAFVCGEDYSFGAGGRGTSGMLKSLAADRGAQTLIVPTVKVQTKVGNCDEKISSTLIREAILRGDEETASRLLKGEAL